MQRRRQDIELLRIFSAFGIVCFHTYSSFSEVTYAGLVVFLILSSRFGADPNRLETTLASKAFRILVPWVVWMGIYGAMNAARGLPIFPSGPIGWGILSGTSIHLWYLPFIFIVLCGLDWIKSRFTMRHAATLYAGLGLFTLGSAFYWRTPSLSLPQPLPQYVHALAPVFVGAFLATQKELPRVLFLIITLALIGLSAALLPWEGLGLTYLIGIILTVSLLLSERDLLTRLNVSRISECMQGVYLSHFFWWLVVLKFGQFSGITLPILIFGASTFSVFMAKRYAPKVSRFIV